MKHLEKAYLLPQPGDSVEFCPHPEAQNIFACGTYQLDLEPPVRGGITPTSQRRQGKCLIFEIQSDTESIKVQKMQEVTLSAVPDLKWCHRSSSGPAVIAAANSEGNITLQTWEAHIVHRHAVVSVIPLTPLEQNQLKFLDAISIASSDVLCLSLDWSNRRFPAHELGSLIVSLSNGSLCLLRPRQPGLAVMGSWHAHDHESWVGAWNYWDTNVLYSGGDDLKMKGWDARQACSSPIFVNKQFDAGVTAIQNHPHLEHVIAVGSYDDTIRLFDTRKPLVPYARANIGGGAWRVKWHPDARRKDDLLVACMHDGFKVIRFDLQESQSDICKIVKRFDQHESLAYGVDWSFANATGDTNDTVIASCSFYDHALHLWSG